MPNRYYPTQDQLSDPSGLARAFKQVLDQHYALVDRMNAQSADPVPNASPASGPADTKLCGLFVEPVDTETMTNGATLKYNKARGTFSFQ